MTNEVQIKAQVHVAGALDGLVIVPRTPDQSRELHRAIVSYLPGLKLHRRAEGLFVAAQEADSLLALSGINHLHWSSDATRFAENRCRVRRILPVVLRELKDIQSRGTIAAKERVIELAEQSQLDPHQLINVAAMTLPESFGLCVFDEQGAGKTISFIFAFDVLVARDIADVAIIVAPLSMVPEWPRDIARFTNGLYRVSVLNGTRKEKLRGLNSGADILVMNFETTVAMEAELRAYLKRFGGRAVLAVDESFFIKNPDANRTRAAKRLREWCDRAYVLCGTPAPNSAHDLVEQFNFVDFGTTFGRIQIPKDRGAAKTAVQKVIESGAPFVRHLKKDVLPDLLGKKFTKVLVELEPVQKKIYEALLRDYVKVLKDADEVSFRKHLTSFFARRSAMLQVCSNPSAVVADYHELPAKVKALDGLVRQLVQERGEKLVIWSFFTNSLSVILERYREFNPVRYDGTVSSIIERREAVRAFQEDDRTMLFVANPAAAGAGLTLHRAKYAIYESLSNQAAHYLQSLDRIHRRGQTREAEYIILLADRSVEIAEFESIERKELQAQELLGDAPQPQPTREAMLKEALELLRATNAGQITPG